jgi:hypothetical protein
MLSGLSHLSLTANSRQPAMPKAADGYQLPFLRCYTLRIRQIRRRELQGENQLISKCGI